MTAAYRSKDNRGGDPGTNVVHNAPSGLADNDILLFFLYKENSGAVSYPSGFVEVGTIAAGTSFWLFVAWKRAASESGTYTFSWTGTTYVWSTLAAYSGVVASGTPLDVTSTTQSNGTEHDLISCPSITTVTTNALIIPFGANGTYAMSTAALAGYTIRESADIMVVSDAIKAAVGATGALVYTHTRGDAVTAAITLALNSARPVPVFMNQYRQRKNG